MRQTAKTYSAAQLQEEELSNGEVLAFQTDKAHRRRDHIRVDSHELHLRPHVTRDSMVEKMLNSFNRLPPGEGSYPFHELYQSSFQDGRLVQPPAQSPHERPLNVHQHVNRLVADPGNDIQLATSFPMPGITKTETWRRNSATKMMPNASRASTIIKKDKTPPSAWSHRGGPEESTSFESYKKLRASNKSVGSLDRTSRSSSCSFDLNPSDKVRRNSGTFLFGGDGSLIIDRPRPVPDYHEFEAAPNPTVPTKQHKKISPPTSPHRAYPPGPALQSSPSSSSSGQEKSKMAKASPGTDLVVPYTDSSLNQVHNVHLPEKHPLRHAPRQTEGMDRSVSTISAPTVERRETRDVSRERTGFFKRVFGSSRNNIAVADPPPQLPPIHVVGRHEGKVLRPVLNKNRYASAPADLSASNPPAIPPETAPVLNKKTSFFRRRKKTLTEKPDNVSQRSGFTTATTTARASVSSLRKVMDPFLTNGRSSPDKETFFDSREQQSMDASQTDNLLVSGCISPASTPWIDPTQPILVPAQAEITSLASSHLFVSQQTSKKQTANPPETYMRRNYPTTKESFVLYEENGSGTISDSWTPLAKESQVTGAGRVLSPASSAKIFPPFQAENQHPLTKLEKGVVVDDTRVNSRGQLSPAYSPGSRANDAINCTDEDGFVFSDPAPVKNVSVALNGANRVWLEPSDSDDERLLDRGHSIVPPQKPVARAASEASSPNEDYASAVDVPIVHVESTTPPSTSGKRSSLFAPTAEEHAQASKIFHGYDNPISQAKAVAVLGTEGSSGERIRRAYMALYDFSGINILLAFRDLCSRLALRGETQQVDRVLASFSQRWCDCNSNHGFQSWDVVHTICYSILLLNTDLHVANMDHKMTKNQFVRNTLTTISQILDGHTADSTGTIRPGRFRPHGFSRSPSPATAHRGHEKGDRRPSVDMGGSENRAYSRQMLRTSSDLLSPTLNDSRAFDATGALVNAPFKGSNKRWEYVVDGVLKEFYISIRQQRLPMHGAVDTIFQEQQSSNNLLVMGGLVRRTGSIVSRAPSEGMKGRNGDERLGADRWNKSRQKLPYQMSTTGSSRTSVEDGSMWSAAPSSIWSKSYFGKTQSTMSSDSLASRITHGDRGYQQSIGFANSLSHAITREEGPIDAVDMQGETLLLSGETFEMAAPWAKEGIVHHKHHLDTTDRRAKDRNWNECFAVIERGWIRLFSFGGKASMRSQRNKLNKGAVVGGGNWTENAEAVGSFMLRQTIANAMPAPGYSKTRPHVFALSLPTGAVHLFQVGTPQILHEFVSTANYWSARSSKEPLVGGVSNVEYGWGDHVLNNEVVRAATSHSNHSNLDSLAATHGRMSMQGSIRVSTDAHGTVRPRLPGDYITLSEWSPPQQILMASSLGETEQLEALNKYVKDVEEELGVHNELRVALLAAFSPRHPNASKAMANWERKSSYLLREIVKFRTYIDSLEAAQQEKQRLMRERVRADELASGIVE